MKINHEKIPTENNKVTLEDWVADHIITNGGTYQVLELIEEKTLPAGTTTTTFSNLDGNTDEVYLIDFKLYFPDTVDRIISFAPNGASTNLKSARYGNWTNSLDKNIYNYWWLSGNGWNKQGYSQGRYIINAKTGRTRSYYGVDSWSATDLSYWVIQQVGGWWSNTTDNITSLVITINSGSFSGVIKLYKKVVLEI